MKKIFTLAAVVIIFATNSNAQSFTFDSTEFCGVGDWVASDWGDYDNDGDMDLLFIGKTSGFLPVQRIYKNDGTGAFTVVDIDIPKLVSGSVAWGDYDKDGDLDILLLGSWFGTYYGRIYRNDGGDVFNLAITGIKGVDYSACAWGDYDNDGDLDFVISGKDNSKTLSILYENNNGAFSDIGADLFGTQMGRVEWGDFDNDRDLDLIISGYDYYNAFNTKVYKNNGNNSFKDMDVSLEQSHPHFFDYNSDGKLDIISGTKIYKNTGDTAFITIGNVIPFEISPNSSFGDYDNDGDLDILNLTYLHYKFFRYDGGTTYSDMGDITTNCRGGSSIWIDYNNDNKLDYFVIYQDNSYKTHFKLYKNTTVVANTPPTVPSGFSVTTKGSFVNIHWTKSTDTQTPQNGIHYNVRIGTTINGFDILNPNANLSTGYRKLPYFGNCATSDSFVFGGLQPGKYYFSVQAIDNNFVPSAFSAVDSFTVPQFDNGKTFGFRQLSRGHIAWGDYDNDGDLDALLNGRDDAEIAYSLIYRNEGDYVFTELNVGLKGIYSGYSEWGDYDNDGDLDIAICGNTKFTYPNFQPVSKVYRNDGNDKFTDLNLAMTGVYDNGRITWGDYDNDGRIDLMLCGYYRLLLYHNDGNDKFSEIVLHAPSSYFEGTWVDIDNDNDLDIVVDSAFFWENTHIIIYKNNGNGNFTRFGNSINLGYFVINMDWADYDNDGYLDLALSGDTVVCIYRNVAGVFTKVFNSTDSMYSRVKWGDFDNDGDPDILASGSYKSVNKTRLYRNDNGVFNVLNTSIDNAYADVAWTDIDNDNDLDASLITGNMYYDNFTKFYLNNSAPNNQPSAPSGLSHSFTSGTDQVNFNWTASTDIEQSGSKANGLTYNVWVRSIDEDRTILDPKADLSNGYRKVPATGNAGTGTSYMLRGLKQGTYVWKVQAIDHSLIGSAFSVVDTFKVGLFADTPSDITLCAGDTITVPMRLDGLAVAGDNTFIAQLSDPYGYFDVPTQIAAVAGTQSATIQVVIPATALAGIKYKIRFLSTSPRYVGVPNMPYITINPRPQPMISGKPIVCQKDIGIDYKTYNAQGNTYVWSVTNGTITSGQNSAQILVKWGTTATGKVKVTESNSLGCTAVNNMDIVINPLPSVILGKSATFCKGQSLIKDPGAFYSYNWNTGQQTRTLTITEDGNYFVQVTNDNGCKGMSDTLIVTVKKPFDEKICMVTTDSVTGQNKIIWDRTSGKRTVSYKIYKISGTSWKLIGTKLFADLSVFNDSSSDPVKMVDRYAITTVDSCGNESAKSFYHQTMLLQAARGTMPYDAVLSWSKYIDESGGWMPEFYYIYKGKDKASIALLDSVSGLLEPRYNDPHFDGDGAYYQIAIRRTQLCSPAILKAESGPYAQSLSNIAEYKFSKTDAAKTLGATVYPNPFSNNLTISLSLNKPSDVWIEVINSSGQKTAEFSYKNIAAGDQQILLNADEMNIPEGMCYLKIIAGDKTTVVKCNYVK